MDQLLKRRAKIVALKTSLRLTCEEVPSLKRMAATLLSNFRVLLEQIDREVEALN